MRPTDRMGIAVTVSVLLSTFTLVPLSADRSYLGVSWVLVFLLGGITLVLRRLRWGTGAVLGIQIGIWVLFVLAASAGLPGAGGNWWSDFIGHFTGAAEHMRTQPAPMEPHDGVKLLFITSIGMIMIMTDLLAAGIQRHVWAIAPPATLFLIPAIGLPDDTGMISFLCIAVGYLGILIAEGINSTSRWTRSLSHDSAEGMGTAQPVVWRSATMIGLPALAITLVLGLITPTLSLDGFGFGRGSGQGGPLELTDPTLDLRRNLNQPEDREVITYRSDRSGGSYLRMASLSVFGGGGWTQSQTQLVPGKELGTIPGLASEPSEIRTTEFSIEDFSSQYLPLPYAPRSFDAPGDDWGYVASSLITMGTGEDHTESTRFLDYTVRSVDVDPPGDELSVAEVGNPPDAAETTTVPDDLPESLVDLTEDVIEGEESPALQAAAIQQHLRSPLFTYSTETQPGSGYEALENFLLNDRTGYCEQFAGAMAMMARVAGIPSRVAVGFLPGEETEDGSWSVSIRDMHAWPELYFSDLGWVRFEPTPGAVTGTPPEWTLERSGQGEEEPSQVPTTEQSADPSADESTGEDSASPSASPVGDDDAFPVARVLAGGGIGLLVLLLLAAPGAVRLHRRSTRLESGGEPQEQVEAAWAEVRDTMVDLGSTWPSGSPRAIGREVGDRLLPETASRMHELADLVERSRYARTFDGESTLADLPDNASEIRQGLIEPESWHRKLRAALLPKSLWLSVKARFRPGSTAPSAEVTDKG